MLDELQASLDDYLQRWQTLAAARSDTVLDVGIREMELVKPQLP